MEFITLKKFNIKSDLVLDANFFKYVIGRSNIKDYLFERRNICSHVLMFIFKYSMTLGIKRSTLP